MLSRRGFLKGLSSAAVAGAIASRPLLRALGIENAGDQFFIFIHCYGGWDVTLWADPRNAQVGQVQPSGQVGGRDGGRVLRRDPSVVQAVRQAQQVSREAITAEVRTLPSLLSKRGRKNSGERTTAFGATRIVAAVRADQEQSIVARLNIRGLRENGMLVKVNSTLTAWNESETALNPLSR